MKKIFFLSRDPGGANVIAPIIIEMSKSEECETIVYGKDYAIESFRVLGIKCNRLDGNELDRIDDSKLAELIDIERPQLVVTGTSSDDSTERRLWNIARERGINSVAVLDSWTNYRARFTEFSKNEYERKYHVDERMFFPDYVFTMDQMSKKKLIDAGLQAGRIIVTGQPFFEYIQNRISSISDRDVWEYRKRLNCPKDVKLIVYASDDIDSLYGKEGENPYWGYDEKTIFKSLIDILMLCFSDEKFMILIRPHPKESKKYWYEIKDKIKGINIIIENETVSDIVIRAADLVVCSQSAFIIETLLRGTRVMSVQIGLKREDPFILSKIGILPSILNETELEKQLRQFFKNQYEIKTWKAPTGAVNNACKNIKEMLWLN